MSFKLQPSENCFALFAARSPVSKTCAIQSRSLEYAATRRVVSQRHQPQRIGCIPRYCRAESCSLVCLRQSDKRYKTCRLQARLFAAFFIAAAIILLFYRISKSAEIADVDDASIAALSKRIELMTNLNIDTAENYSVSNYGLGGHYSPHFDHVGVSFLIENCMRNERNFAFSFTFLFVV